ncbi:SET and MYND domain-containing protein 4-like [Ochlerotatus camptorhynchus]|uniref:SET and MYND domain-containing protein 4-like n=1 Tax=Ochlerotatus camptorhynchus TaxID=644619 RepID=UPI0031D6206C
MWNSHIIAKLLANEQQQQEFQDDNKMFMQLTITRYLIEAFTKNPHLADGDMFAYRDYVQCNVPRLVSEEEERNADLPKCNVRAAKARQEGNKLYLKKNYLEALEKYNESICWAQIDSEDLAIGYANRTAIYYENEEYEFAMANIALAKRHKYPERLMPKLQARELRCKGKIDAGEHKSSTPCPKLVVNVEPNPKIPFVAQGIAMKELPHFGRSMVAERDFKAGSVILCEKPMMVSISPEAKYKLCQSCSSENFLSLIPCPHCVSVMYCSEECWKKGWDVGHRFECGIYDKLASMPFDECQMGPKMLFYGLTLFNDDVKKMRKYCRSHGRTGSNPFDLDYTKENPLDAFKVFHTAKMQPRGHTLDNVYRLVTAILYTIYIQQPLIRSLFVTKTQQNFLLKCIFEYSIVVNRLIVVREPSIDLLHTVASVCNHSCDPNTHVMYRSSQLKFVVIRPICKGEQICISYGPIWGETCAYERYRKLSIFEIDCACVVCNPNTFRNWLINNKQQSPAFHNNLFVMKKVLLNETFSNADKMNALQQFIQRYGYVHPLHLFRQVLTMYRERLSVVFANEVMFAMRERIFASLN